MSEAKLKPCPFCGHAAKHDLSDFGSAMIYCGTQDSGEECPINPESGFHDSMDTAASAWNARPVEEALLAALKAWKEYESSIAPSMSWNELEAQVDAAIAKAEGDQ